MCAVPVLNGILSRIFMPGCVLFGSQIHPGGVGCLCRASCTVTLLIHHFTLRTDDLYDLYDLYDLFPLQFMIRSVRQGRYILDLHDLYSSRFCVADIHIICVI